MRLIILFFSSIMLFAGCSADDYEKVFEVRAETHAIYNTPVYAWLEGVELDENATLCLYSDGEIIPAQIETVDGSRQRIWWVVNLEAGESASYGLRVSDECQTAEYTWERISEHSTRLFLDDLPVIQYEHPVFDPDDIEHTKKPFHHIFEPTGNQLITKGPGGLYSHHRGIFLGYNHVYVGDSEERVDIWHANNGERSEHAEIIDEYSGPVMGGHKLRIYWKDHDGVPFIEEIRDIRVFSQPYGETLIDFHSVLHAIDQPVRLEGDRQHAGVQFRASQYVADNSGFTRFIRPEGLEHIDPVTEIEGADMYNLPWNAMHFIIEESPFTVAYLSHPSNPGNAEMSERLYGRFGEFFPYHLTENNPLEVYYRFWVTEGQVPEVDNIDLKYRNFADNATIVTTR